MLSMPSRPAACLAFAFLAAWAVLPSAAWAHRSFLVPSSTVLSNAPGQWVTVDAARGNDLFHFNHNAMPVEGLAITAPDGSTVAPARLERFRYRAVFDLPLTQPGTWRIAVVDDGVRAQWTEQGRPRRWMGPPAGLAQAVPPGASELRVSEVMSRVETYVTMGAPTPPRPVGKGLEAAYTPHPNDLVAGAPAAIRFTHDGKPAAGLKVTVLPGASRYRDDAGAIEAVTDADGRVAFRWPGAGLYWVQAGLRGEATVPQASRRSVSYAATLEVLPD